MIHYLKSSLCAAILFIGLSSVSLTLQAQAYPEPIIKSTPIKFTRFPLPGSNFDIPKYLPEASAQGDTQAVGLFTNARIANIPSSHLRIQLHNIQIDQLTFQVQGAKNTKKLRKLLLKQFGNPFSLTVNSKIEVLEWRFSNETLYTLRYESTPDDTQSKAILTHR